MNNSNSQEFTVTTVSGNVVPRKNCRFIKKQYYEMNVDCFFMEDNHWHRKDNGLIDFDHEQNKWDLLETTYLQRGIIAVKNGAPVMGNFSPNPAKNVEIESSRCIDDSIPEQLGYVEQISSGIFYKDKNISKKDAQKKGINNRYSFDLSYSASSKMKPFTEAYAAYYKENNPNRKLKPRFPRELGSISFGFEVETSNGMIPERHCLRNGLIPLRDGSLRHDGLEPFEYTTIPLSGEKGLNTMIDISELLTKYTEIGNMCSLHLHIGGYEQTKEFVVAMHRLMLRIQDEVYTLFPANYKFTSENKFKTKDYCAPIKNIRLLKNNTVDQNFEALYNFYSGGNGSFEGFSVKNHPLDRENRSKWNLPMRYHIVNFLPFIWGGNKTMEWRCHVPTLSIHKMINWLYICNAIMSYASSHKEYIASFGDLRAASLENILKDVYSSECASTLIKYVNWRKEYCSSNDIRGDFELIDDLVNINPVKYSMLK